MNVKDVIRLHSIWKGCRQRCSNRRDKKDWPNYGGRGIKVCKEWQTDFETFYNWAINNGYGPALQLGRINNDGPYSPDNCQWETAQQQANNTRANRRIEAWGEVKTLAEWARDLRAKASCHAIAVRLNSGWGSEAAIGQPPRGGHYVTAWGETKTVTEWLGDSRCEVKRLTTLRDRLKIMPPEAALSTPVRPQRPYKRKPR